MAAPTVSFCVPASRNPDDLETAVRSILEQRYEDLEVVVCDDSGGDLQHVVNGIGDDRVRYFANERRLGFAGNHTASLSRARGQFIGILHDDDRLRPGYLEAVLAPFEGDDGLGFVFADCLIDRLDGELNRRGVPVDAGRHADFLPAIVEHDFMIPSTTLMRREVWDRGRQEWPDIILADLTMYVDGALQGWAFHYVDEPLVVYRMHEGQVGRDEEKHRGGLVALWESYTFPEHPEAERRRLHKLAWSLVGLAGVRLKQGRGAEARLDLTKARAASPSTSRVRRLALGLVARFPSMGPPAERAWRLLRPRV